MKNRALRLQFLIQTARSCLIHYGKHGLIIMYLYPYLAHRLQSWIMRTYSKHSPRKSRRNWWRKKIISLRYAEKCSENKIKRMRCCLSSYKSYTADCSCFYFRADYTFGQNVHNHRFYHFLSLFVVILSNCWFYKDCQTLFTPLSLIIFCLYPYIDYWN